MGDTKPAPHPGCIAACPPLLVGAFTPCTPMGAAAPAESPLEPERPNASLPALVQSPSTMGAKANLQVRAGQKANLG